MRTRPRAPLGRSCGKTRRGGEKNKNFRRELEDLWEFGGNWNGGLDLNYEKC
jgi:hypothetical protein